MFLRSMLKRAHIDVIGKCNQRCLHCHMSDFYGENPSKNRLLKIIKKLKEIGVEKVALSGGEPFLRKDLFEILKECPRNTSILTNTTLLNTDHITKLKKFKDKYNKIITLRIGLDGLESHKALRGYDYKPVIKKIKLIKKNDLIVVINTTISPFLKKGELLKLLDLLEKLRVDQWNIDIPFNEGSFKENKLNIELNYTLSELKKLIVKYLEGKNNIRLDIVGLFCSERIKKGSGFYECELNAHPCNYQLRSITINPKGEILVCPSLHIPFGKIVNELRTYRNSKEWRDFVEKNRSYPKGCKECRYLKICGGGCRANAYTYEGDLWGEDKLSCKLMEFLEKEIVPLYPKEIQKQFKKLML